ncbi:hypothetical protein GY45DRAFT_877576 [Cubamyces sp. BRFM 1775]|nr:hypothetical protein GY45DRAFT_877576 [Cubamyces sp. BRFM 1775]
MRSDGGRRRVHRDRAGPLAPTASVLTLQRPQHTRTYVRTYRSFIPVFSSRSEDWDPAPAVCHWSRFPRSLGRRPGTPLGSTQTAAYGASACATRPSADSSRMGDNARSIIYSSICSSGLADARLYGASVCGSVRPLEIELHFHVAELVLLYETAGSVKVDLMNDGRTTHHPGFNRAASHPFFLT